MANLVEFGEVDVEFGKLERQSKSDVVINLIEIIGRVHQMWKFISLNNEKSKLDVLKFI